MSPVDYNYWYFNGGGVSLDDYDPPTVLTPADYKISKISISYNSAGTIATVTVTPPNGSVQSYAGAVAGTGTFNDPDFVINSSTNVFTIGSQAYPLTPGALYSLRLRAYSGPAATGTYGDYYYDHITPPKPSNVISVTSTSSETKTPSNEPAEFGNVGTKTGTATGTNSLENTLVDVGSSYAISGDREIQTSLMKITNNSGVKNESSMAIKNTNISTSGKRYAFGTSLFFSNNINDVKGSGGIGFFTNNNGKNGYFVSVQTTGNLSDTTDREIKIYKVSSGKKTLLNDTQTGTGATAVSGVLSNVAYKLDINVLVENNIRRIDLYVNNFKITAIDQQDVLPVTSNVALVSFSGKTNFDYVYATPLTEAEYNKGILENIYNGKYSLSALNFLYGNKVVSSDGPSSNNIAFLEEFGTVARELRRVKIKYESRPGDPLYASTGISKYATILGQRLTSFGAEIYVLNNSGTFIPLDDSSLQSFSIIGNYIVVSGQHEYVSNTLSETTVAEPVIFESSWIQVEEDAKALTEWIQTQWSKKQQIVELETFGNPLICIGDVIAINYPKNGLAGTEKFIVTKVNNSFKEGLSTTITARSIYS